MRKNTLLVLQIASILLIFTYPTLLLARTLFTRQITGFDDAYMFARYALHWNEGEGLMVWNIGEPPIYGPTSLAYVPVVGLFMRAIPLEPGLVLPIASWTMSVLTLLVLCGISQTLIHDRTSPPALVAVAFISWIVLEPAFAFHSLGGMDTMFSTLAIATLTWSCLLLRQRASVVRLLFATLCAVVSYLVRPDNLLYAFLLPLLALPLGPGSSKRWPILFVAVFGSFVLVDALIKNYWLGDAFPLSYYVKQSGGPADYVAAAKWNPIVYLTEFGFVLLPGLLMLSIYTRRRHVATLAALLLPTLLTFLYYFRTIQIMGGYARFYYPSLAPVFVCGIFVLSDTYAHDPAALRPGRDELRKAIVALLLFIGLGALGFATYSESVWTVHPSLSRTNRLSQVLLPELGRERIMQEVAAMARKFPHGAVLAASEVGYLGASVPELMLIDVTGLNDSRIAHHGFSARALLARKPDFIWLPLGDYPQTQYALLCDAEYQRSYLYFPNAYDYGVAIRKDGPFTADILLVFARNWQAAYPQVDIAASSADPEALQLMCR
jgi:hypothetical protein